MQKFYVVNDVGGGFDGLIVQGDQVNFGMAVFLSVTRIIDKNVNVGDRTLALPIPANSVLISIDNLTVTDDPGLREFASDNPFGQLILEGQMSVGSLKVSYSKFDKVLSIVVTEVAENKTVFSQYFTKNFESVMSKIEDVLKNEGDVEDLVFELRELKSKENE